MNRKYARSILFVIGSLQVGGAERHIATIAPLLVQSGWRVSVFCLFDGGPLLAELKKSGVEVIVASTPLSGKVRSLLGKMYLLIRVVVHFIVTLKSFNPSIVHFFLPAAYLVGGPISIALRIPFRVMSRRSLNRYQSRTPILAWLERRLHPHMTAILGNSLRVVDELRNNECVSIRRLGLIYNGVDMVNYPPRSQQTARQSSPGLADPMISLVVVANLIAYKGHKDLFDALGIIAPQLPHNWRLILVGRDDGIGEELKARAVKLGIAEHLSFLGSRSDVTEIFSACEIGLLCSHEEGFSNAVLEGMAAALPMIVTNVGGNAEAVVDGVTGIVVPVSNPLRLAEAILRLVNEPKLRVSFGEAGRSRILDRFTIARTVEAYESLYRGLLAGLEPCDIEAIRVPN